MLNEKIQKIPNPNVTRGGAKGESAARLPGTQDYWKKKKKSY